MPSYVMVSSPRRQADQQVDAILCDQGVAGYPHHRTATPVRARISETALLINNEPRPARSSRRAESLTELYGQSIEQGVVHVPPPRRLDDVREGLRTLVRF
jgi:hypothetical protein